MLIYNNIIQIPLTYISLRIDIHNIVTNAVLGRDSLIEIEVGEVFGRSNGLGNLVVVENDPLSFFLDVTDVVSTHRGRSHVTNECNQPVF